MKKNSKVAMDSDWEPVLKGSIYCSPACGGRCTKAAFDKAVLGAAGVVKALGGKGWQACIWENLGWHFKVVAGSLAIDCNYNDPKGTARYTATMYGRNPDSFTSKNPREAVEHLVTHCLNAAARSLSDLFAASEAASLKEEFYRVFTETAAVEFLRYPGWGSIEGAARYALRKNKSK